MDGHHCTGRTEWTDCLLAALVNGIYSHVLNFDNTALEGTRAFIHVLSTTPTVAVLTANLNEDWELMRNTYKPYACGLVIHPGLDGCIQLRTAHGLQEWRSLSLLVKQCCG